MISSRKTRVDVCEDDDGFVRRFDDEWRASGEPFQELIARLALTLEDGGTDTKGQRSSEPTRIFLEAAYRSIGGTRPFMQRAAFRHFRNGDTLKPNKNGGLQLALACQGVGASDSQRKDQVYICREAAALFPCLLSLDYDVQPPSSPLSSLFATLDRKSRGDDDFEAYFFRHRNTSAAHYAVYRYSTLGEEIVKTILVVNKPKKAGENWTFRNTMHGTERRVEVQRKGEGLVVALANSVYAIGQAYRFVKGQRANDRRETDDALGLISLAIEKSAFNITESVPMPGLIMSVAREGQPIVARAAVLPLGEFERDWADELAKTTAGIFREANLEEELAQLFSQLGALGEAAPSSLWKSYSSSEPAPGLLKGLAHDILDAMNNAPATHLAREKVLSPKEADAGKGAIETHPIGNEGRPRP